MEYQQFINIMASCSIPSGFFTLFLLLAIWSLIWKGVALWRAGRNSHKAWFVALLVINTLGILEIIYIFFFSKSKRESSI